MLSEDDDMDDDVVTYFTLPEGDDADDGSGQQGNSVDAARVRTGIPTHHSVSSS